MTADPKSLRLRRLTGTVRFRVTALATVAVLVALVVAGVVLVTTQRRVLTQNLDEAMGNRVDQLATAARAGELPPVLTITGDDDSVTQVVDGNGAIVAATANAAGRAPIADPLAAGRIEHTGTLPDFDADGVDYRLLSRRIILDGRGVAVIHAAEPLDDIDDSVGVLRASLFVAVPALTLLLALLIWWLVGRTLRPVEAIRSEVADMDGRDLHRRVPAPPGDDEIARLAQTMNAMLDRVEDSTRRQQRFVADASHELRTPLTRMRSELEVDLAHPDRADLEATHRSVLEEAAGLQHLVDDLLHLARSDASASPMQNDPVDLDDIVLRQATFLRDEGRVAVDVSGVTAVRVSGDALQLGRAIANLAANAGRHAASVVRLALHEADGDAVVTVTDDGPGIPRDQRERVFDRFTRLDEARNGSGGTGLGLAIARDIAERHGGTVTVDAAHSAGARFVMTVPLTLPAGPLNER